MPRSARRKGAFSTYHIIIRGNEKKDIFFSDRDRITFLNTLSRVKKKSDNRKTAREEFLRLMQAEDKADELIMDIDEDQADSGAFIATVAEAREKLKKLKQSRNILPGQPLEKKTRNEMMKLIKQSSLLTLKEIGELFGGLTASAVSKILKSD